MDRVEPSVKQFKEFDSAKREQITKVLNLKNIYFDVITKPVAKDTFLTAINAKTPPPAIEQSMIAVMCLLKNKTDRAKLNWKTVTLTIDSSSLATRLAEFKPAHIDDEQVKDYEARIGAKDLDVEEIQDFSDYRTGCYWLYRWASTLVAYKKGLDKLDANCKKFVLNH